MQRYVLTISMKFPCVISRHNLEIVNLTVKCFKFLKTPLLLILIVHLLKATCCINPNVKSTTKFSTLTSRCATFDFDLLHLILCTFLKSSSVVNVGSKSDRCHLKFLYRLTGMLIILSKTGETDKTPY